MKVLALAGLDGNLQHSHGIVFENQSVIGRRRD
jgi:hypothetical protein